MTSKIGERLKAVERHVRHEDAFLANYTDGLSDFHLPDLVDCYRDNQALATFLSVKPSQSFHAVATNEEDEVVAMEPINAADVWMNGGFFMLSNQIFDYMRQGEELVEEPFRRLIRQRQLYTVRYEGFWSCMDTFKEKQNLDERYARGDAPWELWKRAPAGSPETETAPSVALPADDLAVPDITQPA